MKSIGSEGGEELSFVLFRLVYPSPNDDTAEKTQDLLDHLRKQLPDLPGALLPASELLPGEEDALLLRVPSEDRVGATRRVRSLLKREGYLFEEGVVEKRMTNGGGNTALRAQAMKFLEAGRAFSHLGMLDEALEELFCAHQYDPTLTEVYHYVVAIYRQQGRQDEALAFLQGSLGHQSEVASYHFLAGQLLREVGRSAEAVEKLKTSIRLQPQATEPYLQLGKIFQEQGDFEASELSFLQALHFGTRNPEASLGLGSIALARGEFDSAEDHLLDALDLDPNLDEARLLLGWTYFKDGRYEQAEVEFLQVSFGSQSQYHLSGLFSLAQLYLERGQPALVLEVLERAGDDLYELPEACRVLGDAHYLEGANEEALAAWEQGFAQGLPETSELSLRRAVALSRVGRLDEAEEVLSGLEFRDGATTALLEMRASLRMANEEWQQAYEILNRAREFDPNAPMLSFQLGWVAENLGLLEEAEAHYNRALRLDPTLHEAYSGLGWLYYQREQYREALVLFEEALTLQPGDPEMLEQVGWVQMLLNDDEAALRSLNRAITLDPESPLLRAYRACVRLRLQQHDAAREDVSLALANPDDEMVEALGHYLNALLYLEEGDEARASVELERSLDSQELPPEVVALTLQGPLKEMGNQAWAQARLRRKGIEEDDSKISSQ